MDEVEHRRRRVRGAKGDGSRADASLNSGSVDGPPDAASVSPTPGDVAGFPGTAPGVVGCDGIPTGHPESASTGGDATTNAPNTSTGHAPAGINQAAGEISSAPAGPAIASSNPAAGEIGSAAAGVATASSNPATGEIGSAAAGAVTASSNPAAGEIGSAAGGLTRAGGTGGGSTRSGTVAAGARGGSANTGSTASGQPHRGGLPAGNSGHATGAPMHDGHRSAGRGSHGGHDGSGHDDRENERGLRGLVGGGSTQVSVRAAMRARDAARPTAADIAEAEAHLTIVHRGWTPRDPA